MNNTSPIAVLGTFDTKGEEHSFLKNCIEQRGLRTLTIHVGTKKKASCTVDLDLFNSLKEKGILKDGQDRDQMIQAMMEEAGKVVKILADQGEISGIVSACGGSGTHLCSGIMRLLPLGIPKVILSTVASRDMTHIIGTKDITMMHSIADILGINSILGRMLDKAAAAVTAMARSEWAPSIKRPRIALSFFGFITRAAEQIKELLENKGYEVVTFHANGTGGTAMEELALEGFFDGILDLATHELADDLMKGYCGGIWSRRFETIPGIPRLIVPGGLDCAVLEFNRQTVPEKYKDRKLFFYDFRSAVRLNKEETKILAGQLSDRLNPSKEPVKVLIPLKGWSVADHIDGPLYDPDMNTLFIKLFKKNIAATIRVKEVDFHINDLSFARSAADMMADMITKKKEKT